MPDNTFLFVSPHLDDAVLSCGGYVRRLTAQDERVIIATLVTADLPAGTALSGLARRNHAAWRLGDAPFAARRAEDLAATRSLGAESLHLGLLDMMYRRDGVGEPLYDRKVLEVTVHPTDWQNQEPLVRQKLQEALRWCEGRARVFCPLAAGRHVDHVIVRRAVEGVCEPTAITYYEDFPYASQANAVAKQLGDETSRWQSTTIVLTSTELNAHLAAAACYDSQIAGLFPSPLERVLEILRARLPRVGRFLDVPPDARASRARMAKALRDYIANVGGERYWQCNT